MGAQLAAAVMACPVLVLGLGQFAASRAVSVLPGGRWVGGDVGFLLVPLAAVAVVLGVLGWAVPRWRVFAGAAMGLSVLAHGVVWVAVTTPSGDIGL